MKKIDFFDSFNITMTDTTITIHTDQSYQRGVSSGAPPNAVPDALSGEEQSNQQAEPLAQQQEPEWVAKWRSYIEEFEIFHWLYEQFQIHYTENIICQLPVFLTMILGLVTMLTLGLLFVIPIVALSIESYDCLVMSFYIMVIIDSITFHAAHCVFANLEEKHNLQGDFGEVKSIVIIHTVTTILAFLCWGRIDGVAGQICMWIYFAMTFCFFIVGYVRAIKFWRYKN